MKEGSNLPLPEKSEFEIPSPIRVKSMLVYAMFVIEMRMNVRKIRS